MTRDRDSDDRNESTENDGDDRGGLGGTIRSVLEAIAEAGDGPVRGRGQRRSGRTRIGHEFSIHTLGGTDTETPRTDTETERNDESARGRELPPSTVYEEGEAVVVTIDLPEVDPETLVAGIDEETDQLRVGTDEEIVARVPLEYAFSIEGAKFNNGVLEIRLRPADET